MKSESIDNACFSTAPMWVERTFRGLLVLTLCFQQVAWAMEDPRDVPRPTSGVIRRFVSGTSIEGNGLEEPLLPHDSDTHDAINHALAAHDRDLRSFHPDHVAMKEEETGIFIQRDLQEGAHRVNPQNHTDPLFNESGIRSDEAVTPRGSLMFVEELFDGRETRLDQGEIQRTQTLQQPSQESVVSTTFSIQAGTISNPDIFNPTTINLLDIERSWRGIWMA